MKTVLEAKAVKPLLFALVEDAILIETDLTEEEKAIIAAGMAEYAANPDSFVSLDDVE